MAAATVARWANGLSREARVIGDVLLWSKSKTQRPRTTWITPWFVAQPRPTWKASLWTLGTAMLRLHHGMRRDPTEVEGISNLLERTVQLRRSGAWDAARWTCSFNLITTDTTLLREIQLLKHGRCDLRWLSHAHLLKGSVLLTAGGSALRFMDVNLIATRNSLIGDVLHWEWVQTGTLSFACRSRSYPLTTNEADQFRDLCVTLVVNFPQLLRRPDADLELTTTASTETTWSLQMMDGRAQLYAEDYPEPRRHCGPVTTMDDVERLAGRHSRSAQRLISMWAHPALTRIVSLWPATSRSPMRQKQFKHFELLAASEAAQADVAAKSRDLRWRNDRLGHALDSFSWAAVHRIPGSTSQQRRLLSQVKSGRLSGWDASQGRPGCPHPGCEAIGACDTAHIVWECPAAQKVWAWTTAAWRGLGTWPSTHNSTPWLDSIFSLSFPAIPPGLWATHHMQVIGDKARAVASAAHGAILPVWRLQVLAGLQAICRWRHSYRDTNCNLTAQAIEATLSHSRLRGVQNALRAVGHWTDNCAEAQAIVLRAVYHIMATKPQPKPPPCGDLGSTVLFFDGGSRGNPGPGGAGAVIVRAGADNISTSMVWAGSVSLAHSSTTNNIAEYQGLIRGLLAATRHSLGRVHVVGDSAMIIRQLQTNTPPRSHKLLPLYAHARLLADQLGVSSWRHHYRTNNKMADHLANKAMNARASAQDLMPSSNKQLGGVVDFMANDLGHWVTTPT